MILFSKYHGCGNNFVIIKERELSRHIRPSDYPELAVRMCDISTGAGADGMIVVRQDPALEMVFFNCDGSRAPMCGNGIRCFAHFCKREGIATEDSYSVKTLAGDMVVEVTCREPFRVKINMGKPLFSSDDIKVDFKGENYLLRNLTLDDGTDIEINSLFMGTIHTVVFMDNLESADIPKLGEEICNHPVFKEKTNVNFVKVVDHETLEVKTYERGVGMTLACGTGACASVLVANMQGRCGKQADVLLKLGKLGISIAEDGNVYMEGPSVRILDGKFY